MADVTVRLLRPLNGAEIGSTSVYAEADAKRLAASGAVEILGDAPKSKTVAPENKMEGPVSNKSTSTSRSSKKA